LPHKSELARADKTQSKYGFYRSRDEDHHQRQRRREQPRLVVFTFGAQMQNDFDEGINVFQQNDDSADDDDDEKKRNSESSHHEELVRNSRANFG
jgi:hypothetical protein